MEPATLLASLLVMGVGAVTLLFGRKLYWFFVAVGGFLAGLWLTTTYLSDWNITLVLLIGGVAGVAMGALAVIAHHPLVAVGAFLGIGFLALFISLMFRIGGPWNLIIAVIAGALAAIAVFILHDWALIINSSLLGAGAIVSGAVTLMPFLSEWGGWPASILAALLATGGILFQARSYESAPDILRVAPSGSRRAG
ncbi:MAG: TMEM198/TM7SF3 family protein [Chloroflexaceae bacterium]|nr:TMEM198/TM7SF3 family protein [Chloroflexaceae bacterium]